ncbi:MAG: rhodanese-like domain-containing protein [Rhodobacteraceae bacterium]|nr:rhodanese-like domain-containing protein [Paracoccaceae bacterium]
MKISLTAAIAALGLSGAAAAGTFGPLVTPQELASNLDQANPIILDIRGEAYGEGHLPGAVPAPYSLFRGPSTNPGQLLDVATLEPRFEALGLNFEQPIVIVHEGNSNSNFGAAARVYWTLKSTGFEDLTILNGGKLAWEQAGLPLETRVVEPSATELELVFSDDWTVTTPQVAEFAEGTDNVVLVDARLADFYSGDTKHKAAARPGTVPGAINYAHYNFFDGDSPRVKTAFDVTALKAELEIPDGAEVVSFCNTGHWAATNWFALSEIGEIESVKLYPGSMVEYSNAELPMMNTPGLLDNLKSQLLGDG